MANDNERSPGVLRDPAVSIVTLRLENRLTNQVFQTLQGLPKLRVAAAESHAYAHWAVDFGRSQQLHRRVRRLQGAR